MIRIMHAGALRTPTSFRVRIGGTNRLIRSIRIMDEGTLRTVYTIATPLSAQPSSNPLEGYGAGGVRRNVQATVSAVVTGGLGPYSYAWSSTGPGYLSSTTNASATISAFLNDNQGVSGTMACTVTDSLGATSSFSLEYMLFNGTPA